MGKISSSTFGIHPFSFSGKCLFFLENILLFFEQLIKEVEEGTNFVFRVVHLGVEQTHSNYHVGCWVPINYQSKGFDI